MYTILHLIGVLFMLLTKINVSYEASCGTNSMNEGAATHVDCYSMHTMYIATSQGGFLTLYIAVMMHVLK